MPSRFSEGDTYDTITPEEQDLLDRAKAADDAADELYTRITDIDDEIKDMQEQIAALTAERALADQAYDAKAEEAVALLERLDSMGIDRQDAQAIVGDFYQV